MFSVSDSRRSPEPWRRQCDDAISSKVLLDQPLLGRSPRVRSRTSRCGGSGCSWEAQTTLWGQGRAAALVQGLGEFKWHDGGNLHIDWRWAGGNPALYERYAAELIALDPEVLVVWGSPGVAALRRQNSTIPIVLVLITDPVGQGFVESLARPGGNITGFTDYDPPMASKW